MTSGGEDGDWYSHINRSAKSWALAKTGRGTINDLLSTIFAFKKLRRTDRVRGGRSIGEKRKKKDSYEKGEMVPPQKGKGGGAEFIKTKTGIRWSHSKGNSLGHEAAEKRDEKKRTSPRWNQR